MSPRPSFGLPKLCCIALATAFAVVAFDSVLVAAEGGEQRIPSGRFTITRSGESIQMVVNTSQYLTLDKKIDQALIHNDALIQVKPTGRNEVLVSATATGVAQVDLLSGDETYNVQIVISPDARELQAILDQEFPTANIKARAVQQGVILSGQVTADEHVAQAVDIAELYFPTVLNRMEVIGVHTVMLQTQVMEVSRTKLRQLGIDWQMGFGNDFVGTSASGLIAPGSTTGSLISASNETIKFGVLEDSNSFFGLIKMLRQNNLAKVMADPTVVAIDGRPASFNSGGEFPILVPAGLGQVGVEFREFGTRLDFVAKVRGDGRIFLEVRPTISEIDPGRSVVLNGVSVPGLRSRFVDTAVEMRAGQTLALAGLLQIRTESESIGIAGLADIPYLGALFRSNREVQNEVELLILVTPNFAGPMDGCEVPAGGPGFNSSSPLDKELYLKGYIETPVTCGPENCQPCAQPQGTILHSQPSVVTDGPVVTSASARQPIAPNAYNNGAPQNATIPTTAPRGNGTVRR